MLSLIATTFSFLCLDLAWINLVAVGLYKQHLPDFLLRNSKGDVTPNLVACALFYIVAIGCLYFLAVKSTDSLKQATITGAVAGLFAYGTYAFTGQALFKNWNWTLTVLDVAWGALLCATAAGIGFYVKTRF